MKKFAGIIILLFFSVALLRMGALPAVQDGLRAALMNYAWAQTASGNDGVRPWPWMDSTPVARISVPRLNESYVVMRGVSGDVLAFAPGWDEGTDYPGHEGISLISAHQDTHFGFVRFLKEKDVINLESGDGLVKRYMVSALSVVQEPAIEVKREEGESVLLFSTSYPFSNFQIGGALRLVVIAHELKDNV